MFVCRMYRVLNNGGLDIRSAVSRSSPAISTEKVARPGGASKSVFYKSGPSHAHNHASYTRAGNQTRNEREERNQDILRRNSAEARHEERSAININRRVNDPGQSQVNHRGERRYCALCSETTSIVKPNLSLVKHKHESSLVWRTEAPMLPDGKYPCHTCEIGYHSACLRDLQPYTRNRYPVIVSSSILHQFLGRGNYGIKKDIIHVERCTIPGALVHDLHHAVAVTYYPIGMPVDILFCGGLNDVGRGRSALEVICALTFFAENVKHNLPGSSFAVCSLPLPPSLCRFDGDNHPRKTGFVNRKTTIIELNLRIADFNELQSRQSGVQTDAAPKFHTRGIRTSRPARPLVQKASNIMEACIGHRWSAWREEFPAYMLHPSDKVRLSMGRACGQYFCIIYNLRPRLAKKKIVGQIREQRGIY